MRIFSPRAAVSPGSGYHVDGRSPSSSGPTDFPTDALLQSLVDFVALQLAEKGIVGERFVMAERMPGGLKLPFSADAIADGAAADQTIGASGLAGSQLTVSKA